MICEYEDGCDRTATTVVQHRCWKEHVAQRNLCHEHRVDAIDERTPYCHACYAEAGYSTAGLQPMTDVQAWPVTDVIESK